MTHNPDKPKILIVDDMAINIQILNETLKGSYQTFFATNGMEAINIARKESPDLILLDVMMPDMDGYETCKILKARSFLADIPVIFVTAMSDVENELIGLGLGAVDYIFKPIIPELVQLRIKIHLELKTQRDLLKNLSMQDELSGLPNHRALKKRLDREWHQAKRQNSSLSCILIAVDHLGSYNETFGQLSGDEVLQQVALIISGTLARPLDFAARRYGTEFVCLLPGADYSTAAATAEAIRAAVEAAGIAHPSSSTAPVITICAGVVCIQPNQSAGSESLFTLADIQLFLAKQRGGNQVSVHGEETQPLRQE